MSFLFTSRRRHTRLTCDWSSDVCSSISFDSFALLIPGLALPPQTLGRVAGPGIGSGVGSRSEERRVGKGWWSLAAAERGARDGSHRAWRTWRFDPLVVSRR